MNDGLKDKHRKAIFDILTANPRVERVVLFGSRAMGTFTTTSDVDLALFGDELTLTDQARLAAAIDKLPMAQQVDLLLYKSIDNDKLKQHIKKHGNEWFRRGRVMSYKYDLPDGWLVEEAQNYCVKVADGTHDSPKKAEEGKLLVTSKNIVGGRLYLSSAYHISLADFNEVNRRSKVDKNDVLLSMIGTVGQPCLIEEYPDFAIKNVGLLKNDDPYKAKWLFFYLCSPQAQTQIKERLRGTTQQYLPLGEIRKFPIPYPKNRDELKQLVDVLYALYDKIQLNRQINQTLEEMAQAIFKSWFVDFEPVKAKIEAKVSGQDPQRAAMCAISGKTAAELDQLPPDQFAQLRATAALFPDELNDSELGLIPKGWDVSTIGNEFHATMGQSPPGSTYNEVGEGMAFFQGRRDFGWRYPVNRVYCTEPKRIAKIGDTLLSVRAPVGDVNKATSGCCIGRGIAALRHKTGCEAYTYYSVKRLEHYFSNFDTEGTVFGSINQKDLKAIKLICPTDEMLKIFSKIAGKIDSQILNYEKQISTLAQLRDTLLPKLLSGEISVGSAQSTIDEAV